MDRQRTTTGQFLPSDRKLGKVFGVRIFEDLEPVLRERAAVEGFTPIEFIRQLIYKELGE